MNNIMFSELLYLYADKYVGEASLLQNKEELPNGKKLNVVKLGNLLVETAFAYLYSNNHVDLTLATKKVLGIFPKKVVIATKKSDGQNLTSLEKSLYDLSNDLDVHTMLYRLIGSECTVPWSVITGLVKDSMVNKNIFTKEEIVKKIIVTYKVYKYHVNLASNLDYSAELNNLNTKMAEFSEKDFYPSLVKAIDSGIRAQVERSDSSD